MPKMLEKEILRKICCIIFDIRNDFRLNFKEHDDDQVDWIQFWTTAKHRDLFLCCNIIFQSQSSTEIVLNKFLIKL